MKAPSPVLTQIAWTPELATLLERASLAIGRLDARISASPVASAWSQRAAWTGYARALKLQGVEIDEIEVYSWACGVPLPEKAPRSSVIDEFVAFDAWREALATRGRHWREDLPFTLSLPEGFADAPALLRALEIIRHYARAAATLDPWLHMPMLLHRLGLTRTPLPCLVIGDKEFRFAPRSREALLRRLLKAAASVADHGLDLMKALERDRLKAVNAIGDEHRPGSLASLAALLQQSPLLSPQHVADRLGITLSGAGKVLTRAAALGMVHEVSGRKSWRIYLVPDLAVRFGFIAPSRGRPPLLPTEPPPGSPLADILSAFDAEMQAFDDQYGTLAEDLADRGGRDRSTR